MSVIFNNVKLLYSLIHFCNYIPVFPSCIHCRFYGDIWEGGGIVILPFFFDKVRLETLILKRQTDAVPPCWCSPQKHKLVYLPHHLLVGRLNRGACVPCSGAVNQGQSPRTLRPDALTTASRKGLLCWVQISD